MLKSLGPVMAFVATSKPDKAIAFYSDVLGFKLTEDSQWALVFDAGGTMLRVQKVPVFVPFPFTVLGWRVDDIETAFAELSSRGAAFMHTGIPGSDEKGIWTTPDGSRVAWFHDPDHNVLSITQFSAMYPGVA